MNFVHYLQSAIPLKQNVKPIFRLRKTIVDDKLHSNCNSSKLFFQPKMIANHPTHQKRYFKLALLLNTGGK